MSRYARIRKSDGVCINIDNWDGTNWTPPGDVNMLLDDGGKVQLWSVLSDPTDINTAVAGIAPAPPYDEAIAGGYFDSTTNITLPATLDMQARLTGLATLISTGLQLGQIQPTDPEPVKDINSAVHTLTASQLQGLLYRYGRWCLALAIQNETT